MAQYQDKKVVILGGTSGMGLATAKKLLDGGARVLVTGRSRAGLDSAKQELGADALVVSSDARSLTDIDALAAQVKAEFGTIDLLFVNAGFSTPAPFANVTEAIYDEMFNLNAKGPFFAVQKFAPLINRGSSIVPPEKAGETDLGALMAKIDFGTGGGMTPSELGGAMHRTDTIDLAVVLKGEVDIAYPGEDGQIQTVTANEGDFFVQNGAFH